MLVSEYEKVLVTMEGLSPSSLEYTNHRCLRKKPCYATSNMALCQWYIADIQTLMWFWWCCGGNIVGI